MRMALEKIVCVLFLAACVVASTDAKADTTSAESSEVDDREKRQGSYGHSFQHIGPAFSPASPFQGQTSVLAGELAFHKILAGQLQNSPAAISFGNGNSIGLNGFSQARPIPQSGNKQSGYGPKSQCSGLFPCAAMVHCAPFYDEVRTNNLGCQFNRRGHGACCRFPQQGVNSFGAFAAPSTFADVAIVADIQEFSSQEFSQASNDGVQAMKQRDVIDKELQTRGITLTDPRRPAYGHLQFFRTSQRAIDLSNMALLQTFVGNSLQKRLNLNPLQAAFGLQRVNTFNTELQSTCPNAPYCGKKQNFYRTSDGSCNNFHNPKWGEARTSFERILPPVYADGISIPRGSIRGGELPSARLVSLTNVVDVDRPSDQFTLSVMQWGQFIDHDLTHAPIFRFSNSSGIECCDENGMLIDRNMLHPECFPISIPAQDPFFSQFGRRCMNFVRSMPAIKSNCTLGFREQMNQVTHFLDGSAVYGSAEEEEHAVRAGFGGLLKIQDNGLLPPDPSFSEDDCFLSGTGLNCFLAGDNRVNEQPQLSIMHTIWVRQHNRIARKLAMLNPHWNDETLYQETRRIVSAQIQHIVYNEWLPIILGTGTVEGSGLLPQREGFFDGYDKFLNPNIKNEFATVAFRFGHTLVEGMIRLFGKNHRQTGSINLFENFNRPRIIYEPKKLDELLRGLFKQPMQSFDNFVVDDLTNRLFQTDSMPFGMDLIALNTQRARDHGIASYNELRETCGLPRARNFNDLSDFVRPESIAMFRSLYASVDDIDPFVAGISEVPVNGGILGPTFNCIIRDQFSRLKFGDRFYYENSGLPNSFTEAQLFEIRKTSWASIICENTNHIMKIQPLAFRLPGPNNQKVPCSSIHILKMDCTPWLSSRNGKYGKR